MSPHMFCLHTVSYLSKRDERREAEEGKKGGEARPYPPMS